MKFIRPTLREYLHLRSMICIALILSVFTLCMSLVDSMREFFPSSAERYEWPLTCFLAFWIMLSLLVTYRKWRDVTISDEDLREAISGLNPDVYLVVSPQREIMMCNRQVSDMFGYEPSEVISQKTDLLYYDRRSATGEKEEIFQRLERIGFHLGFATGKKKDGTHIPLEVITGNLKARNGAVVMVRDITKLLRAEEAHREKAELLAQLEANFRQLQASEESRENLVQMIVHDMKTPLQVIMGGMELLKLDIRDGEPADLQKIEDSLAHTRRLVDMVNSLLDISRLEAGELRLNLSYLDMRKITKQAVQNVKVLATGHALAIVEAANPVMLQCDADLMCRVLINLLSNAIKYSPVNTEINVRIKSAEGLVRIEVADCGCGIPEDIRGRVFEKFVHQEDAGSPSPMRSTGIGLTFCKLAVEAHGGQIGVEDRRMAGSLFWIELPIFPADVRRAKSASSEIRSQS